MVRNYKRVTVRKSWTQESLNAAIEAVHSGLPVKRAAIDHGVPRATLRKYLLLVNPADENRNLGRYKPVFTAQQERELVKYILAMEVTLYGVTSMEMRSLAYQLAVVNKIDHPFDKDTELAGREWLYGFRMRHPELSLRTPEATSAARAQGFNKVAVEQFYDVVDAALSTGKFRKPSQFKNVDETCVVTVQSKRSKVLALKGRRQVGAITSAERGVLSTACITSSACGQYLPPMLIFPRVRITEPLKQGAPPGTIFAGNPSGWMTVEMFTKWFDHFLAHTKPTEEDPVLLFLDGHASHTKNLAFIEKARANHVTVISFPPHCSHKLQPLDVSFMGPLKTNFSQAIERFLKANPGKAVTINDVSELLGGAYLKSATPTNSIAGFEKTGLWPFNRYKFKPEDFAAADVTDVFNHFASDEEEPPFAGFSIDAPTSSAPNSVRTTSDQPTVGLSTSSQQGFDISPETIKPLPKVAERKPGSGRRRQKACELTSDAYRNSLKAAEANKDVSEIRKSKKRLAKATSETAKKKKRNDKPGKENLDDSLCPICGAVFSSFNGGDEWEKCHTCSEWFHCCLEDNSCPTCDL